MAGTEGLTLEQWERLRKELLEPSQVARVLRYSVNHIYRLIDEGRLMAFKRGGRWFIPRQSVEEYLRRYVERSI